MIGGEEGNFDHISLVTLAADGPRIANIVLDGVIGAEGGTFARRDRLVTAQDSLRLAPTR